MLHRWICLIFAMLLLLLPVSAEEETELPILMYHELRETGTGKDTITPAELESDLRWLREQGYTAVSMERVIAYVYDGLPLPPKPIVLSFDDGCLSYLLQAEPLLRQYGVCAVLSVIGKSTDDFSAYPDGNPRYAHMTWQQLRQLLEGGCTELQNHSYDLHRDSGGVYGVEQRPGESRSGWERRLYDDLTRLQEKLYAETGSAARVFTYPYGRYGAVTEGICRELGFLSTLTCDFGMNVLTEDPECLMGMKRICRSHGCNLPALLEQAYETRKWS